MGLKQQELISHSLEAGSPRSSPCQIPCLGRARFSLSWTPLFAESSHRIGAREHSPSYLFSIHKGNNPIRDLITGQRPQPLKYSHSGA